MYIEWLCAGVSERKKACRFSEARDRMRFQFSLAVIRR